MSVCEEMNNQKDQTTTCSVYITTEMSTHITI